MEKRICDCKIPDNLKKEMMYEKIAEYIANLSPDMCVDDTEYERRLNICSKCEDIYGGLTCKFCGCFVLARAKKKGMFCPAPGEDRWKNED